MRIDLGGFAKGHAVDNAVAILDAGHPPRIVSAGGDQPRARRPPRPALERRFDPRPAHRRHGGGAAAGRHRDLDLGRLRARYFERDGVRCHHLIDPAQPLARRAACAATILAPTA